MKESHTGIKRCPQCGPPQSPAADYCQRCGSKLEIICTDCKKVLPEVYPYCPMTGKKLGFKGPGD